MHSVRIRVITPLFQSGLKELQRTITIKKPVKLDEFLEAMTRCMQRDFDVPDETTVLFDRALGRVNPLNILVAEDDQTNQDLARFLFNRMGYSPDIVSNGSQAIEAVRRQRYDAVFMDLYMPEMDGLTAARSILNNDAGATPQIFAMTASVTEHDRQECFAAGMNGFISKPIRVEELADTLRQIRAHKS